MLSLPSVLLAGAPPADARAAAAVEVPTLSGSPWPEMRRDASNTGSSPIRGVYRGTDLPWSFRTARGIFSTTVIDDRGNAYVGSADGNFYALDRAGRERWRFSTGGVIDTAAALGRRDPLPASPR